MADFYVEIRLVHVASVIASGSLFLVRGLLVQLGRREWAMAAAPRYLSYTIDTVLLTAAIALVSILPRAYFANGWLAVKLTLLPAYVVCGWFALHHCRGRRLQVAFFLVAVLVYASMFAVARRHDPLGPIRLFVGA